MTVTDVALRSGFDDISSFNRSFKGRCGGSPGSYAGCRLGTETRGTAPRPISAGSD